MADYKMRIARNILHATAVSIQLQVERAVRRPMPMHAWEIINMPNNNHGDLYGAKIH